MSREIETIDFGAGIPHRPLSVVYAEKDGVPIRTLYFDEGTVLSSLGVPHVGWNGEPQIKVVQRKNNIPVESNGLDWLNVLPTNH